MSHVTEIPAADSAAAVAHFAASLAFETDCRDVHDALACGAPDFVLLDVRGPEQYAAAHVPGALNLPHRKIIESKLSEFARDTCFVVYCAGPHCNGAARAALRLARLGRPVKLMLGGVTGWLDEGFALARGNGASRRQGGVRQRTAGNDPLRNRDN
ncbi:rhodanese-like domain-containing protein [Burkholderia pseudomallei]|uniref:rhodanese-like domain-containing protein n=1 Tax=Burkholderia pseudomallei TaxID=28450 RepID=UPI0005E1DF7C|nr:rhodanese-like domain-containing protein [Burkholderia pseudomallei]CPF65737.1 rhodanese-like domain-containing protein [Burkholderia pseudomallei]